MVGIRSSFVNQWKSRIVCSSFFAHAFRAEVVTPCLYVAYRYVCVLLDMLLAPLHTPMSKSVLSIYRVHLLTLEVCRSATAERAIGILETHRKMPPQVQGMATQRIAPWYECTTVTWRVHWN
jgi:hypothetical protein